METCLCCLVWSTCSFSALVPGVTLGQLLKQNDPAEPEDEDGAAKLPLFRAYRGVTGLNQVDWVT